MQNCLVTGATGFIGQSLCHELQKQGFHVRAFMRREEEGPWDEKFIGDFQDEASLPKELVHGVDTIFHLAGIAHASDGKYTTQEYWSTNVEGTRQLISLAIEAGVKRFIFFSSVLASNPTSDYGASKKAAEELILSRANDHSIEVCVLRPTIVYGPSIKGNLLSMVKAVDRGWFPPVPETYNKRSMISLPDLVEAAILVAQHPAVNRNIYCVTDGKTYSTRQMYDGIRAALGLKTIHWSIPKGILVLLAKFLDGISVVLRKTLPFNSKVLDKLLGSAEHSSQELETDLEWKPRLSFYEVLPDIVSAYKSLS